MALVKYRKKPVVVEAFRWTGYFNTDETPTWFIDALKADRAELWKKIDGGQELVIKTLEGKMTANPGDYIIRGVQGEIYPCKPDIFEQTYEAVD